MLFKKALLLGVLFLFWRGGYGFAIRRLSGAFPSLSLRSIRAAIILNDLRLEGVVSITGVWSVRAWKALLSKLVRPLRPSMVCTRLEGAVFITGGILDAPGKNTKKSLDTLHISAYKPPLADGAKAPMALMKTEEEKETQTQSKDCSRSASQSIK